MLIWFLPIFLVFLLVGLPVFFALLAAPGLMLWLNGQERDITLLYRNVYNGIDSFPLMAIPFFMLAGELMNIQLFHLTWAVRSESHQLTISQLMMN